MQITGHITADNLMSLEAYSKFRKTHKAEVLAHRKMRSVHLGEHITLQFESETTIRYQIQEMLRIEKIFEEEGIQQEIDAYTPLVPDGSNWKATLLIEYPDVEERKRALGRLIGIEDRMYVEVEGAGRVYAIADEDLDRENEEKTSAVHFLRFAFDPATVASLHAGAAVAIGCDHPACSLACELTPATRAAIIEGLLSEKYMLRDARDLVPTAKAFQLMTLLRGLGVEELSRAELTGDWEFKLSQMEKGLLSREAFMQDIAEMTGRMVKKAKEHEFNEMVTEGFIIAVVGAALFIAWLWME